MKDLFSGHAKDYSRYRPSYSQDFFAYLQTQVPNDLVVWDCATGNGQVAKELLSFSKEIHATDISENQLKNAFQHPKISYTLQAAEKTNFSDKMFDVVIVGQAIHWFQFEEFYREVRRVAKQDALLVLTGYGNVYVNPEIDTLLLDLYNNILDGYWEPERRYIDEKYETLPFPFEEISHPDFVMEHHWSLEQFMGYLNTWSAIKKFEAKNRLNPLPDFSKSLQSLWPKGETLTIRFEQLCKMGRIVLQGK